MQRSLKEAEAQSFQLYHPQVDQAIRKKEELHKACGSIGNRLRRRPRPGGGTRSWSLRRCWTMRWLSWRLSQAWTPIYSAWTTFPLIVKTQRRGRNAEGSTSDKWMGNILQMRKEAVPFLESLGIPKPRSKEEWSYIFKEMRTFLAAKNFIVNCPLPVMEIPVAPIHDSKEALRFRAVCDERITLPLASLKAFDSVYTKLVAGLSKSSMVEVKVNWRCNVVHDWVEQVPQEAAGALYDRLGYSEDLIRQLGCSPPWVPLALEKERPRRRTPGGGGRPRSAHQTRAPGDTRPSPRPRSRRSTSTSTSPRRRSMCFGPPWSVAWSCQASVPGKW